jgi:acetoin utilization deacetylase AcuC-like enzyme
MRTFAELTQPHGLALPIGTQRVVSVSLLEGGYNLSGLASAANAHVEALSASAN